LFPIFFFLFQFQQLSYRTLCNYGAEGDKVAFEGFTKRNHPRSRISETSMSDPFVFVLDYKFPSRQKMNFDEVVDVVIAGTGAAGCAAACGALLQGGAGTKVVILEKAKRMIGGTTKLAGGGWLWAPGNPNLLEKGIKYDSEETLKLLRALAYPDGNEDPNDVELMKSFAEDWPKVIAEIMKEKIMVLQDVSTREEEDSVKVEALLRKKLAKNPKLAETGLTEENIKKLRGLMPSYCCEHELDNCPSGKVLAPSGGTTSSQLEKSARRLGAEIRTGSQVVDVIRDERGRVIGAKVLDAKSRNVSSIRARHGVIFGTGGFSHNREMLATHFGENMPMGTCSSKTNTGDFAQIAEKHGIPVSQMHTAWLKQCVLPYNFRKRLGVFFINADSYVIVDKTGNRYSNEKQQYNERGLEMFDRDDRRCVFFVYDERASKLFDGPIKSLGGPIPDEYSSDDCVIEGSSVDELTQGVKEMLEQVCPEFNLEENFASSLGAQITRFNDYACKGQDLEFHRGEDVGQYCWSVPRADNKYPSKVMHPIDTSNLRCVILGLATLDTKGGPRINRNGQVLDASMKPIPGLYGAGNCVRSPTNNSYPASGATLSNAILFGIQAGKHAVSPTSRSKI